MDNDNQLMTQQPQQMTRAGVLGYGPADLDADMKTADMLANSGMMPDSLKGKPAALMAVVLKGRELGLDPMQSIGEINVIKGRTVLSAALIHSLALRSESCLYFRMVEVDDTKATFETQRKGDPEPTRFTYSIKDAEKAGLTRNPTWTKHRKAMLIARCRSFLARLVYPDAVGGLYDHDEGKEIAGMYDAPPPRQPSQPPQPHPQQHPAVGRVTEAFEDAEVVEESPDPAAAIKAELAKRGWKVADLNAWLREVDSPPIETIAQDPGELAGFADDYLHKGGADAMAASIQRRAEALTGNR